MVFQFVVGVLLSLFRCLGSSATVGPDNVAVTLLFTGKRITELEIYIIHH